MDNGNVLQRTLEERTLRFPKQDLVKITHAPVLNLPGIKEIAAYKLPVEPGSSELSDEYLLVECEPDGMNYDECPNCHAPNQCMQRNGYTQYPRLVHDVNIGLMQVDLELKVPKYKCSSCENVVNHNYEAVMEGRQFTKRLYDQIEKEAFYGKFTDIAEKFGISDTTVTNIFDEYIEKLEEKHNVPPVGSWLAIDEKHVNHKMRGVFVDGESGRILDITEDNSPKTVEATIRSFKNYENVKIVTMDMACGYRSIMEKIFGADVKVIVDKWHVLNDLSVKITQCRTAILSYLETTIKNEPDGPNKIRRFETRKEVAGDGYLFRYGGEKLAEKPHRLALLAKASNEFPEINHLRLLKEGFELIYQCSDRASAEQVFEKWSNLVPPSGKNQIAEWEKKWGVPASLYEVFRPIKNTVGKLWRKEVFNYFDDDGWKTNAIAEATNSFIERVLINGYTFKRMRAKALFWHEAGSRKRYVLLSQRVPVEKEMNDPHYNYINFSTGGFDLNQILHPNVRYEDRLVVVEEIEPNVYPPLSVFRYLPKKRREELFGTPE